MARLPRSSRIWMLLVARAMCKKGRVSRFGVCRGGNQGEHLWHWHKRPKSHVANTLELVCILERPGYFPCGLEGLRPGSICKTGRNRPVCSAGKD
ncbi:hypothetical protein ASPBRDRAFT_347718 [Aspergillus brasiliensis CBS 101740]|uniref:Uncharacterized protein n=1 Tax=Aspergillus brasiliensis (strain CBS 101740 / IMI 381727 / IBT 21946) TaxID=767769 RepID=A0A1L9U5X7_ASPBC|nr:hypothetical protein ASPBRDRAFT_347718 [Aspergillus brasiliensis CBS 101740]